ADARPNRLQFLTEVVRAVEPQPEYVETLMIGRLADLGLAPPLLARALEVVRYGEQTSAEPASYPWLTEELEVVSRSRHEALVQLLARGYAPRDGAAHSLDEVRQRQTGLLALQRSVVEALAARDDAREVLPSALAAAERAGSEAPWLAVASLATD